MISKEYIEGLQKQVGELQQVAARLFDIGDGEVNVSRQRSNAEMAFYAQILHLQGYVEVLNADSWPSQSYKP